MDKHANGEHVDVFPENKTPINQKNEYERKKDSGYIRQTKSVTPTPRTGFGEREFNGPLRGSFRKTAPPSNLVKITDAPTSPNTVDSDNEIKSSKSNQPISTTKDTPSENNKQTREDALQNTSSDVPVKVDRIPTPSKVSDIPSEPTSVPGKMSPTIEVDTLADKLIPFTSKTKNRRKRSEDNWRRKTQPITVDEISTANR